MKNGIEPPLAPLTNPHAAKAAREYPRAISVLEASIARQSNPAEQASKPHLWRVTRCHS
jgi:hypothetical protein